jgi:hypothetical protein
LAGISPAIEGAALVIDGMNEKYASTNDVDGATVLIECLSMTG